MLMFTSSWMLAAAAYVLFAGQFSADELVAAAACGLVTALWALSVRRATSLHFRFERAALSAVARAIARLPQATAKSALVLAKTIVGPVQGFYSERPFLHGTKSAPADAGRRAVALLALSLAPNSFVLRAPHDREEINMHDLATMFSREDVRWPV